MVTAFATIPRISENAIIGACSFLKKHHPRADLPVRRIIRVFIRAKVVGLGNETATRAAARGGARKTLEIRLVHPLYLEKAAETEQ